MKTAILATLSLLFLATAGIAQTTRLRPEGFGVIPPEQQPLVIVDSVVTDLGHLLLNPDKILSIDILKDAATIAAYGDRAKYGVLIIRTKEKAGLLNLADLLDQFHIPAADRNLRVCIDNILVKDKHRILADKANIISMEVITDICWISPMEPGPEERYINIVTKKKACPGL